MSNSPVILITGATRGIGYAAAEQLTARGARVILTSRDAARAEAAAARLGAQSAGLGLDPADSGSVNQAMARISQDYGRLDVLVNNSATLLDHYGNLLELDPDVLTETFRTNVTGTLRLTRAAVPLLTQSNQPRIINVSSGAGQLDGTPQAWAPAYSISKTALNMLTQQLTAALPGVTVNSMCPGWCRTEMGGAEAPRSAAEGADTLVWLALDAPPSLRGSFIKDRAVIPW